MGTPQSWEGKGNGSVKSWGREDEVHNIPKELIKKQKQNIKRKRNTYMGGGQTSQFRHIQAKVKMAPDGH